MCSQSMYEQSTRRGKCLSVSHCARKKYCMARAERCQRWKADCQRFLRSHGTDCYLPPLGHTKHSFRRLPYTGGSHTIGALGLRLRSHLRLSLNAYTVGFVARLLHSEVAEKKTCWANGLTKTFTPNCERGTPSRTSKTECHYSRRARIYSLALIFDQE